LTTACALLAPQNTHFGISVAPSGARTATTSLDVLSSQRYHLRDICNNMIRMHKENMTTSKSDHWWRSLRADDIPELARVADKVHPGLPESNEVFLERVMLFPEGCMALVDENDSLSGYAISHPIRYRQIPQLNHLLGCIAPDADQYFIHDIAILPECRGLGHAQQCIGQFANVP
jgi:ribosomal protein S18 acetylase RimI-like enzyme